VRLLSNALRAGIVVVAYGCGGGLGTSTSTGALRMVEVTLQNDSPLAICIVRMGPGGETDLGSNWLGDAEPLEPGGARTFRVPAAPDWSIRLESCEGWLLADMRGLDASVPAAWLASSLRPNGDPDGDGASWNDFCPWDPGGDGTGYGYGFGYGCPAMYGGYPYDSPGVPPSDPVVGVPGGASGGVTAGTPGDGTSLTLTNDSALDICGVLIAPTARFDWGDSLLAGGETIADGASRTFALSEPGEFDVGLEACNEAGWVTAVGYHVAVSGAAERTVSSLRPTADNDGDGFVADDNCPWSFGLPAGDGGADGCPRSQGNRIIPHPCRRRGRVA
jgi:hypothetical protein